MDDEQLLAVKKSGGVVQIVGFSSYLKTESKERAAALAKLRDDLGFGVSAGPRPAAPRPQSAANRPCPVKDPHASPQAATRNRMAPFLAALPPERRAEIQKRMADIDAQFPPPPRANVQDLVNHIDYAVN